MLDGIAPISSQFSVRMGVDGGVTDTSGNESLLTRAVDAVIDLSNNDVLESQKLAQSSGMNDLSPSKLIEFQEILHKKQLGIQIAKNISSEVVSGIKTLTQQ